MKPADRYQWLLKWIEQNGPADAVNRYLVDEYVRDTGAKCIAMPFGADKCKQLGRDLGDMYRSGVLHRYPAGISDMSAMGFPKWVWSYTLPKQKGGAA